MNARSAVLVDASPLIAILDPRDPHHEICLEAAKDQRGLRMTTWPVITEAAYMLRRSRAQVRVLYRLIEDGALTLAELSSADLPGIRSILDAYPAADLQLADASLMHLAKRDSIHTVFTLDRRHFSAIPLGRGRVLQLVP